MASNRLPDQLDRLFALAEDMADGLAAHETDGRLRRPQLIGKAIAERRVPNAKSFTGFCSRGAHDRMDAPRRITKRAAPGVLARPAWTRTSFR
jgi:hypothetical protein